MVGERQVHEWAEENQDMIDIAKIEPLTLGKEPEWVSVMRSQRRTEIAKKRWEEYA